MMHRTHVRRVRATLVSCVVVALSVGFAAGRTADAVSRQAAHDRPPGPAERMYLVREGDTLWRIAATLAGPEGDPRPLVDELARANAIENALILPGERLVLP